MYKPIQTVPSRAERLVARSMALMETTDELLCRALAAVREANAPMSALADSAIECAGEELPAEGRILFDLVAQEFRESISTDSAQSLARFVGDHPYVLDRIRERADRGIFQFPAVAVTSYWLAAVLENSIRLRWPLAGSHEDLSLVLSDLGIGEPVH